MDHEIEDDVDIERAGREDAEPVCLEKHGSVEIGNESADGRVEPFQMTHLQNEVARLSTGDEVIGFLQGAGEGLLDEDMDAGIQQGGRNRGVGACRRADRGCMKRKRSRLVGGQAFLDAGEMAGILEQRRLWGDRIDDGREVDGVAVLLKLTVDADMVLAERARTADCQLAKGQRMRLARSSFALHGDEAATVEFEQVGDLVVRFGSRWRGETGGGTAGLAADAGGGGYEFEQVKGDIFITTGCGAGVAGGNFHGMPP